MMTYEEQLLTPEWKSRRAEILERDWYMCQKCMSSKNLQVHHKKYIDGLMAWEYSDWYLITLCGTCHKNEHEIKGIEKDADVYQRCGESIRSSVRAVIELMKREAKKQNNG